MSHICIGTIGIFMFRAFTYQHIRVKIGAAREHWWSTDDSHTDERQNRNKDRSITEWKHRKGTVMVNECITIKVTIKVRTVFQVRFAYPIFSIPRR